MSSVFNWQDKTILIVEDTDTCISFFRLALRKTKINIVWAGNGEEAIQVIKDNDNISLVLMDVRMPVMNGYEATREVKKIRPELPVIIQTAYGMMGDEESYKDAGADDFIFKPIKLEVLIDTCEKYLK